MKKYSVFGLNVLSELDLEKNDVEFDTADVTISYGKIPEIFNHEVIHSNNNIIKYNTRQLVYRVNNIASFFIEDGNKIIIEPFIKNDEKTIKIFLNGLAFSALFAQRGVSIFHGSCLKKDDQCLLIMGDSGAGKSSLSTGLIKEGYKFITDDIIVFDINHDDLVVYPGFPESKLSLDLIEYFNLEASIVGQIVSKGALHEKYFVDYSKVFYDYPTKVTGIVQLKISKNELMLREITGIEKLDIILKNTYKTSFMKFFNKELEKFKMVTKIAEKCPIYTLWRPHNILSIDKQIELLENTLKGV